MSILSTTSLSLRQRYGWNPDRPDHRDIVFNLTQTAPSVQASRIDLRAQCPPVFNQGALGSCTANAISAAYLFDVQKQKLKNFTPSRLFIYYNTRAMEQGIQSDAGGSLRNGLKSIAKQGVCSETSLPYDVTRFTNKPSLACYKEALLHQALQYQRVTQSLSHMKTCLSTGYPFVFGFTAYDAFESPEVAKSGVLHVPLPTERPVGGHAVLAVGYDDASQRVIVQNSWGTSWGHSGFFTMPYAYIENSKFAQDFWMIKVVE